MNTRTAWLISFVCTFLVGTAMAKEALDGKSFSGTLMDGGKPVDTSEVMTFKNGMLRSSGCDKHGYKETSYKTSTEGGTVKFEAKATNPAGETMEWRGWVKGSDAEATGTWMKGGKTAGTYSFKGKAKN